MHRDEALDNPEPEGPSLPPRRRLTVLALLLLATLALGIGLRHPSVAGPNPPPARPGSLLFQAPSGGPVDFSGRLDRGSVLAGGDGLLTMELVLRGEERADEELARVSTDMVVVLDRSGSMGGEPLAHAKAAVESLMGQLADDDRFALVSYASDVRLDWPLAPATAENRERWRRILAGIPATGATNMATGLDLANQTLVDSARAGRAARVVLLSDGHANQGDHSRSGLTRRAARAVKGEYVLSAAGVGQGFDESLMAALAGAGTGNFYYVQHVGDLARVFAGEFATARKTVASGLAVTIRPEDGVEVVDASGFPLERGDGEVRFRPGDVFAGQERHVWVTLRAPTTREGSIGLGRFDLTYKVDGERRQTGFSENPTVTCVRKEDDYFASFELETRERSILNEELGVLKRRVSEAVRAGDASRASSYISFFYRDMKLENAHLKSKRVDELLDSLDALDEDVAQAFDAPEAEAPALQNQLGKELSAEGWQLRNLGYME